MIYLIFSSIEFLLWFLPIFLIVYGITPRKYRNLTLLVGSIVFYARGDVRYLPLLMISILCNYFLGLHLAKRSPKTLWRKKLLLILTLGANLAVLLWFKDWGGSAGLPLGISFYTFQILSYQIDVYRGEVPAQHNFWHMLLYISFFPQLIAGPIVKYRDIAAQITGRKETIRKFAAGIMRFCWGLGKKVLLANSFARVVDEIFKYGPYAVSRKALWLGAILYMMQIYYDFSGYSDMAIGLGQMLGFNFNKNFDYPYISTSVSEFWRRWHISLGSWFRDYIYIPLGGNRVSTGRHIRNILVVWALTGLWHGASWNFVFWGIYYGLFLLAEKFLLGRFLEKAPVWLRNLYTMFAVIIGWVFFSQTTPAAIGKMLGAMFGFGASCFADRASLYALKSGLILMIISVISCRPGLYQYFKRLARRNTYLAAVINAILFFLCIAYMIYSSYTPFMYQQF